MLQRKAGYRELLHVWLQFHVGAQLAWDGGREVWQGGARNVATLYEYWLFFQLEALFRTKFDCKEALHSILIEKDAGLPRLKLERGIELHTPIGGVWSEKARRPLNAEFHFNKKFNRDQNHKHGGSWTRGVQPDYTISIWPAEFDKYSAEKWRRAGQLGNVSGSGDRASIQSDDGTGTGDVPRGGVLHAQRRSCYLRRTHAWRTGCDERLEAGIATGRTSCGGGLAQDRGRHQEVRWVRITRERIPQPKGLRFCHRPFRSLPFYMAVFQVTARLPGFSSSTGVSLWASANFSSRDRQPKCGMAPGDAQQSAGSFIRVDGVRLTDPL